MFATRWQLGAISAEEALAVRRSVLMEELSWPDEAAFDVFDEYAAHLVVYEEGKPVASARLYGDEAGEMHMGHVCVLPGYRGKRYGDLCFRVMMDKAVQMGAQMLHIRVDAAHAAYFSAFGFMECGEEDGFVDMQVHPSGIRWGSC